MGSKGDKEATVGGETRARLSARRKPAGAKANKPELVVEREDAPPDEPSGRKLIELAKKLGFSFTSTDPMFEKRVPSKAGGFTDAVVGLYQWHTSDQLRAYFPKAHKHSGRIYAGEVEAARRALEYYVLMVDEMVGERR